MERPLDPGPQYDLRANSVWLYTRPDVAKLHMRVLDAWSRLDQEPIIANVPLCSDGSERQLLMIN